MSGIPAPGPGAPRIRIKGHAGSVIRFFLISVAFTVLWILVTSQLGHYSKLFGPEVLLRLNLAFYLPSVPVLLASGSLERALDARLGPIGSISARLNAGLAGCMALAALFPLLPGLRAPAPEWPLMLAVALMGGLSAVAFSTAYQLVQFFRAADTIGLGVGCVGSGPIVLLLQLGLGMGVGPNPERWQWIAMFEVAAGLIGAGLLSASSLCGQYWAQLNAATGGADASRGSGKGEVRQPLLGGGDEEAGTDAAGELGSPGATQLSGAGLAAWGRRPTTAPDPFNTLLLPPGLGWNDDDSAPPILIRRCASAGFERGATSGRSAAALRPDRSHSGIRSKPSVPHYLSSHRPQPPPSPDAFDLAAAAAAAAAAPIGPDHALLLLTLPAPGMGSAPPALRGGAVRQDAASPPPAAGAAEVSQHSAHSQPGGGGMSSSSSRLALDLEFGNVDALPPGLAAAAGPAVDISAVASGSASTATISAFAQGQSGEGGGPAFTVSAVAGALPAGGIEGASTDGSGSGKRTVGFAVADDAAPAGAHAAAGAAAPAAADGGPGMTVHQEVVEVVKGAWQVMLGFLVSVTVLYLVFPFFTYVPSSGLLGESLPQVLFYTRLFTDLAGRLLPRIRALQLRSGAAVLALATASAGAAACLFAYMLAPPSVPRHDAVPVVLVLCLWAAGGYLNSACNMLAPSQVPPGLAGRATAVMAIIFNFAHIGGLLLAAMLAAAAFGTVVG